MSTAKEWFNGFVAGGLQFRLDGYEITKADIQYKIVLRNITDKEISISNCVKSQFENDYEIEKDFWGRIVNDCYGHPAKKYIYRNNYLHYIKDGYTESSNGLLKPGKEYFFVVYYYRSDCYSEHDFSTLYLKIPNFISIKIETAGKEDNYAWYICYKTVTQNYGVYVPVTSVPNTEDEKLTFLLRQDSELEKLYGIKISNCNVHKNEDGSCDVTFELHPNGEEYCHDVRVTACVYNRSEKPVLLQSIDIRDFENFNVYTIKGLQMLPTEDISSIFVFPTKLA